LNPAKQSRKAAFNRAGDAVQRSRWTFYEAIKVYSRTMHRRIQMPCYHSFFLYLIMFFMQLQG